MEHGAALPRGRGRGASACAVKVARHCAALQKGLSAPVDRGVPLVRYNAAEEYPRTTSTRTRAATATSRASSSMRLRRRSRNRLGTLPETRKGACWAPSWKRRGQMPRLPLSPYHNPIPKTSPVFVTKGAYNNSIRGDANARSIRSRSQPDAAGGGRSASCEACNDVIGRYGLSLSTADDIQVNRRRTRLRRSLRPIASSSAVVWPRNSVLRVRRLAVQCRSLDFRAHDASSSKSSSTSSRTSRSNKSPMRS